MAKQAEDNEDNVRMRKFRSAYNGIYQDARSDLYRNHAFKQLYMLPVTDAEFLSSCGIEYFDDPPDLTKEV